MTPTSSPVPPTGTPPAPPRAGGEIATRELDALIAEFGREVVADNLLDVVQSAPIRADKTLVYAVKARLHRHPSAIPTARPGYAVGGDADIAPLDRPKMSIDEWDELFDVNPGAGPRHRIR